MRPTSDLVREAVFQILSVRMEFSWDKCRVLDLFAGTGALGLEALSRGAREVLFADRSRTSCELIRRNIDACGFQAKSRVIAVEIPKKSKGLHMIEQEGPFELILADPPYSKGLGQKVLEWVVDKALLARGGTVVLEEYCDERLPDKVIISSQGVSCEKTGESALLECIDKRRYGQTAVWFYKRAKEGSQSA